MRKNKDSRILTYYLSVLKPRPPFQVICDSELLAKSVERKIDLKSLLISIFKSTSINIGVTACTRSMLNASTKEVVKLIDVGCCHPKSENVDEQRCIRALAAKNNPKKYFFAVELSRLRRELSRLAFVPLFLLNNNILMLNPANAATREHEQRRELKTGRLEGNLAEIKEIKFGVPRARRVAKNPNPLSVKKKKRPS